MPRTSSPILPTSRSTTLQSPSHRSRGRDLGIVDALVQTSFLIHELLSEIAAEYDLSITQARLLGVLRDREPRMTQLAELLGLSKQSTSGLIDRAERRDLLRRMTIPVGDERAVHVSLTDTGRKLTEEVAARMAQRVSELAADLSPSGQRELSTQLSRFVWRYGESRGVDLEPHLLRKDAETHGA